MCGLLPFARLSLRPILRELSFVVGLLPLAGRGRRPHFFDVRRLLLDARAALRGARAAGGRLQTRARAEPGGARDAGKARGRTTTRLRGGLPPEVRAAAGARRGRAVAAAAGRRKCASEQAGPLRCQKSAAAESEGGLRGAQARAAAPRADAAAAVAGASFRTAAFRPRGGVPAARRRAGRRLPAARRSPSGAGAAPESVREARRSTEGSGRQTRRHRPAPTKSVREASRPSPRSGRQTRRN